MSQILESMSWALGAGRATQAEVYDVLLALDYPPLQAQRVLDNLLSAAHSQRMVDRQRARQTAQTGVKLLAAGVVTLLIGILLHLPPAWLILVSFPSYFGLIALILAVTKHTRAERPMF